PQLDLLTIRHTARDAGVHGVRTGRATRAVTVRARVLDDGAATVTGHARLGHREPTHVPGHLTVAPTGEAHGRGGPRAGTGSGARRAGLLAGQPQWDGDSVDGVGEVQRHLGLDVGPAPRPGPTTVPE